MVDKRLKKIYRMPPQH